MADLISRGIYKLNKIFHESTSFMRVLPDFLIVGNSFCCKTLLYNYVVQHPLVLKNLREETAFWVEYYDKGTSWYKSNFPTLIHKNILKFVFKSEPHVGETVNIPLKEVPSRIHGILPELKIIVVLRNPIDRMHARYLANIEAGIENRKFEEAILHPVPHLQISKKMDMNKIDGMNQELSSYLIGSIYIHDLKRWNEFFPKEKWLILTSENLINDPLSTVNSVLKFLGLNPLKKIKKVGYNLEEKAKKINPETRNNLKTFFEPYNNQLFKFLGQKFNWE